MPGASTRPAALGGLGAVLPSRCKARFFQTPNGCWSILRTFQGLPILMHQMTYIFCTDTKTGSTQMVHSFSDAFRPAKLNAASI